MKKKPKHFEDMSVAELAQVTKVFDQEFVFERARPMSSAEVAQERRLRVKTSRDRKGAVLALRNNRSLTVAARNTLKKSRRKTRARRGVS